MGKASTWIKNFLMGKGEDKNKKQVPSILPETHHLSRPAVNLPVTTPKVKRRWSFKRSSNNKVTTTHKSTKSFDSILIPKQGLLEYETQHTYVMPLLLHANAAATKIQAVYRSYLARRALRALRGLVKIQALARGHLVRKQMTAVMRSMHAVLAIQVRARIHRVQMAEELLVSEENATRESIHQIRGAIRSRSGHIDHILAEGVDHDSRRRNSVRISVSKKENQLKMCPNPSTSSFTESSCTTYSDEQLEEFSLKMAQRNSKRFANPNTQCPDYTTSNSEIKPNYMTNTESSKAKNRSHSEPRRRHKSQKAKQTSSMDGKNDKENQYSWLVKFYRSSNFMDDEDCDSITEPRILRNY